MIGTILTFILAHQVALAGVAVAILDFAFAMKSDWKSNGLLHMLYTALKAKAEPKPAEIAAE